MFTGEIRGLWWLPETPTQVVSGVLTIAYDERPTLLFLGPLAPDDGAVQGLSLLLQGRREVPCVLGRTSNGEEVTLGTSTLTVRDMHLEDPASATYELDVRVVFIGGHIDPSSTTFDR